MGPGNRGSCDYSPASLATGEGEAPSLAPYSPRCPTCASLAPCEHARKPRRSPGAAEKATKATKRASRLAEAGLSEQDVEAALVALRGCSGQLGRPVGLARALGASEASTWAWLAGKRRPGVEWAKPLVELAGTLEAGPHS